MIKTLTHVESKFLREILPHYYRHLTRHPSTFLTHFYGMYRVCMPDAGGKSLHFIIMRSVFRTEKKIDRVWDLKGSRAGRRAGPGDGVGKDLDILEEGRKLRFAEEGARGKFLDQLAKDATFLARLGIMDYSLLLGLHDREGGADGDEPPAAAAGGEGCEEGGEEDAPPSTPREGRRKEPRRAAAPAGEPSRSNTPFRRGVLQRASSAGDTQVGDDGFRALEAGAVAAVPPNPRGPSGGDPSARDPVARSGTGSSGALNAIPEAAPPSPGGDAGGLPVPANVVTSRSDSGIEGFGVKLEDGSLAKREIYFCGVIDILQYYNARKLGETVIRKAAGNSGQDISCVDPETYGKRFVRFISNLVEE
ncbi:hypothetical protein ACHAWF_005339 [Thalassiosira exigua]